MLCANLVVLRHGLVLVLWAGLAPLIAVNTIATAGTVGLGVGDFDSGLSNVEASGGFGPNQVSALVGLGALFALFLCVIERRQGLRLVAAGLVLWFVAQGALTFSRGGMVNLLVALIVAIPFAVRSADALVKVVGALVAGSLLVAFVMVPALQSVTGGSFGERFTDRSTTLRSDLMSRELEIWGDNVWLGVGVGMAERGEEDIGANLAGREIKVAAHTEYTRLLAEHGIAGIAIMVSFIALLVGAVGRNRTVMGRAWAAAAMGWTLAEMVHSATRLAVIPLMVGLAQLTISSDVGRAGPSRDASGSRGRTGDRPTASGTQLVGS